MGKNVVEDCRTNYPEYSIINNDSLIELSKPIYHKKFDLVITSPPYNVGKEYEVKTSIEEYLNNQRIIIDHIVASLSDRGSICWQVGNYVDNGEVYPLDIFYYSIFKEFGLQLRNRIIWHFGHGLHASNRFSGRYETILWFTKSDDYIFNLDKVRVPSKYPGKRHYKGKKKGQPSSNPSGKNPSDLWDFEMALKKDWNSMLWNIPNVKSNHPEKTIHPCQFPIELVERCILALTDMDSWVLDPFAGVGSTILGSLITGRKSVGIEKDAEYCDVIQNRVYDLLADRFNYRVLGTEIHVPKPTDKVAQIPKEWVNNTNAV